MGLSWDGEWHDAEGSGRIYSGMNLCGAVDGRTSVNVSSASSVGEQGLSVDGKLGLSCEWNGGCAVRRSGGDHGDDVEEDCAKLGVRIDF